MRVLFDYSAKLVVAGSNEDDVPFVLKEATKAQSL